MRSKRAEGVPSVKAILDRARAASLPFRPGSAFGYVCALLFFLARCPQAGAQTLLLDPGPTWRIVGLFSQGRNYYAVGTDEDGRPLIHAGYRPPAQTAILGRRLDKPERYARFSWRWRVQRFPLDADEKVEGRMDNAAAVYLTLSKAPYAYVIKYVWSQKYAAGEAWPVSASPFEKMRLVVRRGPSAETGVWREESIDIAEDFRRYFGLNAESGPPPVVGIGLLSDGDGTRSEVDADYADLALSR
jgi:hypothetical protein